MVPYFYILGKQVPWYGVLFAVGMLVGGFASGLRRKRFKIEPFDVMASAAFAGIFGLVGAKILAIIPVAHIIFPAIAKNPALIIPVLQNGFVFYGGLIGGFIGLIVYTKWFKLPTLDYLDVFAVSVPLGHVFGRVGCFISGCCYGMEYHGPLAYTYGGEIYQDWAVTNSIPELIGVPRLPVQLIEAFLCLCLYIVLEIMFHKTKKRGLTSVVYLYSYAVIRYVLEFFRADFRGGFFAFSTSQIVSILIVLTVTIVLFRKPILRFLRFIGGWFMRLFEKMGLKKKKSNEPIAQAVAENTCVQEQDVAKKIQTDKPELKEE